MSLFKRKREQKNREEVCVTSADGEERVCSPDGSVKGVLARDASAEDRGRKSSILIGTLNFFVAPYRSLKDNYDKRYAEAKKFFIIDLILLAIVGCLAGFNIYLGISQSNNAFWGRLLGTSYDSNTMENTKETGGISETDAAPLELGIRINSQDEILVNPGEELAYSIQYQNKSGKPLYDLAVKINLEGAILDFDNVSAETGAVRGRSVVWTKDQISEFGKLPPDARGELKFKIGTVANADPALAAQFGGMLKSQPEIFYKKESGFSESVHWTGEAREDEINSDLAVVGIARYYTLEGDQLGRGPLPPVIGKTTKYWIFLSTENTLNDLSDVSVSALLPENVAWTGNVSVSTGELDYNEGRRLISWRVGQIYRYAGEEQPKQGIAFELALTPDKDALGKEMALLQKLKIFGRDELTSQFLEKSSPALTTNLIYDGLAKGKAEVVAK